ncbi:hypothetical protein D3C83_234520 [compost metagenome]
MHHAGLPVRRNQGRDRHEGQHDEQPREIDHAARGREEGEQQQDGRKPVRGRYRRRVKEDAGGDAGTGGNGEEE